jgi:Arf-GAP/Rho-GAP domain/ANK repeat/PH domain-containing protein 3
LKAKFVIGERTGCKADPTQVEKDMRTSRNPSNERMFNCTEWRTKSQIKGFFSRLAVSCRKEQGLVGLSLEQEEDVECLVKDSERQELIEKITDEIGLKHPITFDTYDICEYYHKKKGLRLQFSNAKKHSLSS